MCRAQNHQERTMDSVQRIAGFVHEHDSAGGEEKDPQSGGNSSCCTSAR